MTDNKLQYCILGFFDILGFSAMVESDSNSQNPKYLPIILDVLNSLEGNKKDNGPEVKIFSDSIILTAPLSPESLLEVIETAADLQRLFLKNGILIRGGISFGKHYSSPNVMFSQALISAYQIESKIARFPRIVIKDDALNYAWHTDSSSEELKNKIRNSILIDRDGALFVHYLSPNEINNLTPNIKSCIETNTQPSETVLEKMRWLLDYQNYSAGIYNLERLDLQHFANGFQKIKSIN